MLSISHASTLFLLILLCGVLLLVSSWLRKRAQETRRLLYRMLHAKDKEDSSSYDMEGGLGHGTGGALPHHHHTTGRRRHVMDGAGVYGEGGGCPSPQFDNVLPRPGGGSGVSGVSGGSGGVNDGGGVSGWSGAGSAYSVAQVGPPPPGGVYGGGLSGHGALPPPPTPGYGHAAPAGAGGGPPIVVHEQLQAQGLAQPGAWIGASPFPQPSLPLPHQLHQQQQQQQQQQPQYAAHTPLHGGQASPLLLQSSSLHPPAQNAAGLPPPPPHIPPPQHLLQHQSLQPPQQPRQQQQHPIVVRQQQHPRLAALGARPIAFNGSPLAPMRETRDGWNPGGSGQVGMMSPLFGKDLAAAHTGTAADSEYASNAAGAGAGSGYLGGGHCDADAGGGAGPRPNIAAADAPLQRRGSQRSRDSSTDEIDINELTFGDVIGQGAFGRVHKGKWRGTPVAIKVLVCPKMTLEVEREFKAEVTMLSALRHPNVCLFMGAVTEGTQRCLVTELAARGSLWDFLHGGAEGLDWKLMLSMANDVSRGIHFLHSHSPPILHRDLKSGNLLLDAALVVKLADFGLARVKATATMTANRGTFQWMAPECLASTKYTEKADVYSFGVVCWELLLARLGTPSVPFAGMHQFQAGMAVVQEGLRPEIPSSCPASFRRLLDACFEGDTAKRASMADVIDLLEACEAGGSG